MDEWRVRRRTLLSAAGSGAAAGLAGCAGVLGGGGSAPTAPLDDDRSRELAAQFAPTYYFDADETWFPTDPRPHATERDGDRVVTGFDAVNGYLRRRDEAGAPPDPTVFYNGRTYEGSPLSVVQFWTYSAFDQFTTNFHWHDWEVVHVFVDDDSGAAQLFVASAHARGVPNNEYLDPSGAPRVLPELGSHSSGVSFNDFAETFQRFPDGSVAADVTNEGISVLESLTDFPAAYGLPRDEGVRLPYVVPELDGDPVYEHPEVPRFERDHLAPPELTVRDFGDLARPPSDLPARETGLSLGHESGDHDAAYELVPASEVEGIDAFTGPQLSFEFAVPGFAEDLVASHLTATETPWTQPRYEDPVQDVTDARHRAALADRYDAISAGGIGARVVGVVRDVVPDDSAPDGEGVTTTDPTVESVALFESDPVAVPSFRGVVVAQDLPPGEHRMTVNAAGKAPHAERVEVGESEDATAGVEGDVPLVANEAATKLRVDPREVEANLRDVAVADDFGGRLYAARLDGPDAVYVHRGGAYTVEVVDEAGAVGAHRVNHALSADSPTTVESPDTGKAALATFLADVAAGTHTTVSEAGADRGVGGLLNALDAVQRNAERAAERAAAGNGKGADASLRATQTALSSVQSALDTVQSALPGGVTRATDRRLEQANRRAAQAIETGKL